MKLLIVALHQKKLVFLRVPRRLDLKFEPQTHFTFCTEQHRICGMFLVL